ncbi:MAG: nicotinate (nicotinamide) nucleotide adenylyltransferase [Blastocatellia bacterium]|nr:nicotinate (nicotinamide) nucleotide adenylyltransferase [Blastocatellia bacterium]
MRIGILGGTFDPIHSGHVEIAQRVQTVFACDKVLLIPAYSPPHKPKSSISSSYHRYAMAVVATSQLEKLEVSTVELEAPSQPFTVQTLEKLLAQFGSDTELFFVMGADSFKELEVWWHYQKILSLSHLVVVTRPGYDFSVEERSRVLQTYIEDLRGVNRIQCQNFSSPTVFITNLVERSISATAIRQTVAERKSLEGMVPKPVAEYISKYRLYQEKDGTEK